MIISNRDQFNRNHTLSSKRRPPNLYQGRGACDNQECRALKVAPKGNKMPFYARSRSAWIWSLRRRPRFRFLFLRNKPTRRRTRRAPGLNRKTKAETNRKQTCPQARRNYVTGSNIRTDVSERAAVPLTIISVDDIAKQAQGNRADSAEERLFSGGT